MTTTDRSERVAVGFRVKTGRAIGVLVAGPVAAPRVLERLELTLHDPALPESFQPWHAGLEQPAAQAAAVVARLCGVVHAAAAGAVRAFVAAQRARGRTVAHAGIVAGSLVDPTTIAAAHPRAHAAEGKLYREVLADALAGCGLQCTVTLERELLQVASRALTRPAAHLTTVVAAFKQTLGSPWRAEEKAAALAAWLALAAAE